MGVTIIDNTQVINNATWKVQADKLTSESGIVKEDGTIHYIDGKLKYHANDNIFPLSGATEYGMVVIDKVDSTLPTGATVGDRYLLDTGLSNSGVYEYVGALEGWLAITQNSTTIEGTLVTVAKNNVTYRWSGTVWAVFSSQSIIDLTLARKTDSYTLVAADNGKCIEMNKATANTLTVPSGVFTIGQQVLITQYGAGQTTIAGSGVTLRSDGGKLKINSQYSSATILFISATEAYVFGNLAL
jgi:hypothetical protein